MSSQRVIANACLLFEPRRPPTFHYAFSIRRDLKTGKVTCSIKAATERGGVTPSNL